MIEEYRQTAGHGRGYPTGLSHEEKMDVIACLLDEGEKTYVMMNIQPEFHQTNAELVKWLRYR